MSELEVLKCALSLAASRLDDISDMSLKGRYIIRPEREQQIIISLIEEAKDLEYPEYYLEGFPKLD